MCEAVVGAPFEIQIPRLAWKVVTLDGLGPFKGYATRALSGRPGSWRSASVLTALPAEAYGSTSGGLHVFFDYEYARSYARSLGPDHYVIPVIVWGRAVAFRSGAAVQFATRAER